MKTFQCAKCDQQLFFENSICTSCGSTLAFLPDEGTLDVVEPTDVDGVLSSLGHEQKHYRHCKNRLDYDACNWAIPISAQPVTAEPVGAQPASARAVNKQSTGEEDTAEQTLYCESCALNEVVPDLSQPENVKRWARLESAKRRLLYTLKYQLRLSYHPGPEPSDFPLVFRFLADTDGPEDVITGHADGVITINIDEADGSKREATREQMGERYRTLLGHFRHEVGHYYWARLIEPSPQLSKFRKLFGDDRADYQEALAAHYAKPKAAEPPPNFISFYASSHPWEDWAESWAHYLHMLDTLETAHVHGLTLRRATGETGAAADELEDEPLETLDFGDFDALVEKWQLLTVPLNSLCRSMGVSDAYPFALSDKVVEKVRFVHDVIWRKPAA